MTESRTSSRRLFAAENRTKALELRKAGATFAQIAKQLSVSRQRAHKYVSECLDDIKELNSNEAEMVLKIELERLDTMLLGLWDKARRGDNLAIDRVLKIMDRRAKYLGLDDRRIEIIDNGEHRIRLNLVDDLPTMEIDASNLA